MNVALSWWHPSNGGSQQAIRGNVKALREAGHDVTLYYANELDLLEEHQARYDFVVLPYLRYDGDLNDYEDAHVHLQLGGFASKINPGETARTINKADTVSTLDPSYIDFLAKHAAVNKSMISFVPNALNDSLFEASDVDGDYVLVAGIGSAQKPTASFLKIARECPDTQFKLLYSGQEPPEIPYGNVLMYPAVPFTRMQSMYEDAMVVLNSSHQDVLPNTAFEAFMTGTPYVVRNEAVGFIQSVQPEAVNVEEFGCSVHEWMDEHQDQIGAGDHFLNGREDEELGRSVRMLSQDREMQREVSQFAFDWLREWDDWSWKRKGEVLTEVVESNGPL